MDGMLLEAVKTFTYLGATLNQEDHQITNCELD